MNDELKIEISSRVFNKTFLPYLNNDSRYLVFYGGAGSGKSYFVCERYIYKMMKNKRFNLLVVRKTGKSNRDSTFALEPNPFLRTIFDNEYTAHLSKTGVPVNGSIS